MTNNFSHLDDTGGISMVDVGAKRSTMREAVALATVRMSPETLRKLVEQALPKGDVLTTAINRSLSHGFGIKSRAPRFIASTARSIVAHAVITTIGSVLSSAGIFGITSNPSCPDVVSRV